MNISTLHGTLHNQIALSKLMSYAFENHCEENLLFWCEVCAPYTPSSTFIFDFPSPIPGIPRSHRHFPGSTRRRTTARGRARIQSASCAPKPSSTSS